MQTFLGFVSVCGRSLQLMDILCFSFSLCLFVLPHWEITSIIGERRRDHAREKYGGVARYGCFSLGDRACCHGAGLAIGGSVGQWLNRTDCFIIEKFFPLFPSHPVTPPFFLIFFPSAFTFLFCLFHSSFINIMNFQTAPGGLKLSILDHSLESLL